MVESNAAKTASNWAKGAAVLAGVAVISSLVAPGFYIQEQQNVLTEDQIDASVQKAIALQSFDVNVSEGPKVVAIYEEIFEQDAWESESEVLALEEVEHKDYRELGDYISDEYGNIEDEDDIEEIVIKDVTVTDTDVDDKDATVELELKVYYENLNGKTVKKYITATATIEDGEVEELEFTETA